MTGPMYHALVGVLPLFLRPPVVMMWRRATRFADACEMRQGGMWRAPQTEVDLFQRMESRSLYEVVVIEVRVVAQTTVCTWRWRSGRPTSWRRSLQQVRRAFLLIRPVTDKATAGQEWPNVAIEVNRIVSR